MLLTNKPSSSKQQQLYHAVFWEHACRAIPGGATSLCPRANVREMQQLFMGLWLQSTNKKLHTLELEHGVQLDRLSMVEYLLVYQIPSNSGSKLCVQNNIRDLTACSNSKLEIQALL